MCIEAKKCEKCKETIYGSREREADGYRTWWDTHYCPVLNKSAKQNIKKVRIKYNYKINNWVKV